MSLESCKHILQDERCWSPHCQSDQIPRTPFCWSWREKWSICSSWAGKWSGAHTDWIQDTRTCLAKSVHLVSRLRFIWIMIHLKPPVMSEISMIFLKLQYMMRTRIISMNFLARWTKHFIRSQSLKCILGDDAFDEDQKWWKEMD